MWDYSFAVSSLLVITIIVMLYFSLPRLKVRMNRMFLILLMTECLVVVLSVSSSYVDNDYQSFPMALVHFLNAGFFACFYFRSFVFFAFLASVMRMHWVLSARLRLLLRVPYIACVALAITSPYTDLVYYFDESGFVAGPLYNILYLLTGIYLLLSYIFMVVYRQNLKRKRHWYCLVLYQLILTAGIIIRKAVPQMVLFDTFCVMAIIVVYLTFQNPEFYLERRTSVFNSNALTDYLEEKRGRAVYRVIGLIVHNYRYMKDIYGGNQMKTAIEQISEFLFNAFRNSSVFYIGNGRFVILTPVDQSVGEVLKILDERFEKAWYSEDNRMYLRASYVQMEFDQKVPDTDLILSSIENTMEEADRLAGKGALVITQDVLNQQLNERLIRQDLERATNNNAVEVYLQPLVEADSGEIIGAEALARIRNAEGELIPPGLFIPIAEENGKINELGEQVFEKTCRFIKENQLEKYGIRWINVNVSPVQFMRADLPDRYTDILEKYRIDSRMIRLEITEKSIADDNYLKNQILGMRKKGFFFVLDDYGTGYSNMTRVKKYPVENVKMDMSLIWDYCKEPDEILPNAIATFKHMKFTITAEGVETAEMVEKMKAIGCDYLQGYFFMPPVSMDDFLRVLKERKGAASQK